jgi:hypothetical protein
MHPAYFGLEWGTPQPQQPQINNHAEVNSNIPTQANFGLEWGTLK